MINWIFAAETIQGRKLFTEVRYAENDLKWFLLLKFIYSKKTTIFTVDLFYVIALKSKAEISQNVVAFSEYMNFTGNIATIFSENLWSVFGILTIYNYGSHLLHWILKNDLVSHFSCHSHSDLGNVCLLVMYICTG